MQITGQRHAFMGRYRAAMSRSTNKLKALDIDVYNNAGFSLDLSSAVCDRALFHLDNAYHWAALRGTGHVCRTNQASHTAFRGFGGPQGMFLTETVIDHLARTAGVDPSEVRGANLYAEGERTHFGQVMDRYHVPELWRRMHDPNGEYHIDARREACRVFNAENRWRKRALAVIPTKFGINFTAKFMNQGGALVHVYTDGTVLVSHGGTEMGQGLHTKVAQVAAHAFGIAVDDVQVTETATDKVANTSPTAASMSTDLYGMATLDACEQIKARLAPYAEKMPGADFNSIVQTAFFDRVNLSAQGYYAIDNDRCGYDWGMSNADIACNSERGMPFNYFTQGVAACEVEVDVLTGDLHQRRVDVIMDVGKSINPALDVGQIEGAWLQGFGLFTMEELSWGDSDHSWVRPTGALFTRGPGTYKIPSFNDVPKDFRIELYDNQENPFAVHSSKAIGEPPLFLASAAFFAVKEAVAEARKDAARDKGGAQSLEKEGGYFLMNSPASSERVRMACGDKIATAFTGQDEATQAAYQPKGSR
jgi:xanthine dehydrogenase/oxidase